MGDIYFVALPFIHPAGETMDSAEHGEAMVLGYKAEERDRGRVQLGVSPDSDFDRPGAGAGYFRLVLRPAG